MYRITQGIDKLVRERGNKHGLSSTQVEAVLFLSRAHPDSRDVSSVARRLGIAQPTATRVISSLEAKGVVSKERRDDDRRKLRLDLTSQGEQIAEELVEISLILQEVVQDLSKERKEKLNEDLKNIAGKMQRRGLVSASLTCIYCKYFESGSGSTEDRPHCCKLTGNDITEDESRMEWVHEEGPINLIE